MSALALIRGAPRQDCRPHPRHLLDRTQWTSLAGLLATTPDLALLALWAEPAMVHACFLAEPEGALVIASCPTPDGRYRALSPARPGAIRFERAIHDLWGLVAEGAVDLRPWLDHGRWPAFAPLSAAPKANALAPPQPEFLAVEGEGVHQIPVGPVHAGIIEPGHFRFHVQGETVVRLEQRLGYLHKGIIGLMLGKPPEAAARLAARLSGDSTVAHSWAFAQGVEAAAEVTPPPRALALRGVMAELERLAQPPERLGLHLQRRLIRLAARPLRHIAGGRAARRRRRLRPPADDGPGGARRGGGGPAAGRGGGDPRGAGGGRGRGAADRRGLRQPCQPAGPGGRHRHRQGRAGRRASRAGGPVGRASGRGFDARAVPGYAPYAGLKPAVPVLTQGDVDARVRIRMAEIDEAVRLAGLLLDRLPAGPLAVPVPPRAGEGLGLVEGFRGECLHWVALDPGGLVRAAFPRDPSWLQWPLLEAAIEGNIVADFPLCNKSFNCSYSGVDL